MVSRVVIVLACLSLLGASGLMGQDGGGQLPVRLSARITHVSTPSFIPGCQLDYGGFGLEARSRGPWHVSASFLYILGLGGEDIECLGKTKTFGPGLFGNPVSGFDLDGAQKYELSLGRTFSSIPLDPTIAVSGGGFIAETRHGQTHPWVGVVVEASLYRGIYVALQHGRTRYPIHYTIYREEPGLGSPVWFGETTEREWGSMHFFSVGIRH